jgi:hypothetical protein
MKNTLNRHRYYNPKQTLEFKNPEFYSCYMPHIKKKKNSCNAYVFNLISNYKTWFGFPLLIRDLNYTRLIKIIFF